MALQASIVGLAIAMSVLQIHGVDRECGAVLRKPLRRSQSSALGSYLHVCSAWKPRVALTTGREPSSLGHDVRLIAPQFFEPYSKSQKTHANDAEAIAEAVSRPSMRFAPLRYVPDHRFRLNRCERLLRPSRCRSSSRSSIEET